MPQFVERNVHVLEKHDKANKDQEQMNQRMKQAVQHTVAKAAAGNAAIPGGYSKNVLA
jgi:hypothetical protein